MNLLVSTKNKKAKDKKWRKYTTFRNYRSNISALQLC